MASIASLPVEILSQCCLAVQDAVVAQRERIHADSQQHTAPVIPVRGASNAEVSNARTPTGLVPLSETCQTLRAVSVPLLWGSIWLSLDSRRPNRCIKQCLSLLKSGHPAQSHAKELCISVTRGHTSISSAMADRLDLLLAHCVHSMPNLVDIYAEIEATRHAWPNLLLAIMRSPKVRSVQFNGTAGIQLPRSLAFSVERVAIDARLQRSFLDLLCFPALRHLSLGFDDIGQDDSWSTLAFPLEMWARLESLELHGYCREPSKIFRRIRHSMGVRAFLRAR